MGRTDRPRLVFAHYFGGSGRSWKPLIEALGGAFDCVTPDLIGFGGSLVHADTPTLQAYTDQVLTLAGKGPCVLVGHSMGGKIVLAAAAQRPANVEALVLIAPSPPSPEPMDESERRKTIGEHANRGAALDRVIKIANAEPTPQLVERFVADEMRVDRAAWLWWLEQGSREDISGQVAGLDVPTLVISGDKDKVLGPGAASNAARYIRGAKVETIPGGGHLVPLEQPDAVAASIRHFLDRLGQAS